MADIVQVDYEQVVSYADKLSLDDQVKLEQHLKRQTLKAKVKTLSGILKGRITEEEALNEVEIVREERYRAGLH